jgi:uncharacterized protein YdeI (BOF family)
MRNTLTVLSSLALALSVSAFANDNANKNANMNTSTPSIQQIVTSPSNYVGKTLTLNGKIDRVLPNGDFIMKAADSNQSILVFTVKGSQKPKGATNQQAGTFAPPLQENQKVQVKGKVDELVVTNEYDVLNMKKNREQMSMVQTSTPVLLVRPADVKTQG